MYLNPTDKIDQFILRELEGEPIPFDEWEDLLEELNQDDPTAEELLAQLTMTREEIPQRYCDLHAQFHTLAMELGYPFQNRYLCCLNFSKVKENTQEHLQFITLFLSDMGEILSKKEPPQSEEEVQNFLAAYTAALSMEEVISRQCELSQQWEDIQGDLRKPITGSMNPLQVSEHEVFNLYQGIYQNEQVSTVLLDNFALLLSDISCSPLLHQLAPLYLYQMIVKHSSRLRKNANLTVRPDSLWKPTSYRIDEDNGKNFLENEKRLFLFHRLCQLFARDEVVDLPLCGWGFQELSNLAEFYRENLFFECVSVLPPSPQELLDEAGFTCFPSPLREESLHNDGTLTPRQIQLFQEGRTYRTALQRISDYMNTHAQSLAQQFLDTSPQEIRHLCVQVLHDSKLPPRMLPKNMVELACFTYSINEGLLELVDYFAQRLLLEGMEGIIRSQSTI